MPTNVYIVDAHHKNGEKFTIAAFDTIDKAAKFVNAQTTVRDGQSRAMDLLGVARFEIRSLEVK